MTSPIGALGAIGGLGSLGSLAAMNGSAGAGVSAAALADMSSLASANAKALAASGNDAEFAAALADQVGQISALPPTAVSAGGTGAGLDVGGSLARGFDSVAAAQHSADTLAAAAASGQIVDPAELTIAVTKATLMTQVASSVQSKAVQAFNTIMGMQA